MNLKKLIWSDGKVEEHEEDDLKTQLKKSKEKSREAKEAINRFDASLLELERILKETKYSDRSSNKSV